MLRAIIILFLLIILVKSAFGKVFHNENEAFIAANNSNKLIFSMVASQSCPHCKDLKDAMLTNKNLMKYIQKNFIILYTIVEIDNVPSSVNFKGFTPLTTIVEGNGEIIGQMKGNVDTSEMYKYIRNIQKAWKKHLFELKGSK